MFACPLAGVSRKPAVPENSNCLVVLGPTAVGKTALAVRLAEFLNAEILSADSRQVYKGLDIGSGKDLNEYTLPYHLIDISDLSHEYSVFDYQKDFFSAFADVKGRGKIPIIAGGTGLYIDSVIRSYDMRQVPENPELREKLSGFSAEELSSLLCTLKEKAGTKIHNSTDTLTRARLLRAIEIQTYKVEHPAREKDDRTAIHAFIIGTSFPRDMLRSFIRRRLKKRLRGGMIEEVQALHRSAPGLPEGASWERLERLGLEYRFVSQYIRGLIPSIADLEDKLGIAIGQFAKRQETWFRGMEKKGLTIHWLEHNGKGEDCSLENRFEKVLRLLQKL